MPELISWILFGIAAGAVIVSVILRASGKIRGIKARIVQVLLYIVLAILTVNICLIKLPGAAVDKILDGDTLNDSVTDGVDGEISKGYNFDGVNSGYIVDISYAGKEPGDWNCQMKSYDHFIISRNFNDGITVVITVNCPYFRAFTIISILKSCGKMLF